MGNGQGNGKEGRKEHKNDRRKRKKAVEEVGQKEGREESEKKYKEENGRGASSGRKSRTLQESLGRHERQVGQEQGLPLPSLAQFGCVGSGS